MASSSCLSRCSQPGATVVLDARDLVAKRRLCRRTHRRPCVRVYSQSLAGTGAGSRDLYTNHRRNTRTWDTEKELSRAERRTTFTHDDWKRHRSSRRYLYHLQTFPQSGIVRGVIGPVLWVLVFTTAIAVYNTLFFAGRLASWAPQLPAVAIEPLQLTSFALSLLLVFRTNSSYSRWEEARRSFGRITTTCRDIARQVLGWFDPADQEGRKRITRWLVALAKSTMCHLREGQDLREELDDVLLPDELEALERSMHRPSYCLEMLTKMINRAGLPQELVIRLDENTSQLTQAVSACERILNTPIPLSYTRHTARFLLSWMFCLPFSLWSYCGWMMVPIAGLVAFVLLGIEEIGVYIEEPFSILPLEQLCNKLDNVIRAMLREHEEMEELLGPLTNGTTSHWQSSMARGPSVAPHVAIKSE